MRRLEAADVDPGVGALSMFWQAFDLFPLPGWHVRTFMTWHPPSAARRTCAPTPAQLKSPEHIDLSYGPYPT